MNQLSLIVMVCEMDLLMFLVTRSALISKLKLVRHKVIRVEHPVRFELDLAVMLMTCQPFLGFKQFYCIVLSILF